MTQFAKGERVVWQRLIVTVVDHPTEDRTRVELSRGARRVAPMRIVVYNDTIRSLADALHHARGTLDTIAREITGSPDEILPGLATRVMELADLAECAEVSAAVKGLSR